MLALRFHSLGSCAIVAGIAALMVSSSGCALWGSGQSGTRQWSDDLGRGMRGAPENSTAVAPAQTKEPFWEKYRDKRVNQINENLSVEEPAGW